MEAGQRGLEIKCTKEEEKNPEVDSPCRAPEKVRNLRQQVPPKGRVGEGAQSLRGDELRVPSRAAWWVLLAHTARSLEM